jgi:FkbM family methyltransferase
MSQRGRPRGALIERVLERGLWGSTPFRLVDVGCRGGLERRWRAFGDHLEAIGFDPFVAEIERLTAANTHPGIRYVAARVTCRDYDRRFPPALRNDTLAARSNQPFQRVSAVAALRRLDTSYNQLVLGGGVPLALSDRATTIDDSFDAARRPHVDFLKIDTDGADIEVILGAEETMSAGGILGISVEVQFHGPIHDYANTFTNIDRILRQRGFTLFDLHAYRYSRAALPAPFATDLCAHTTSGQILCGQAVYFRDLATDGYERMWSYEVTAERVMKLACLFDLFELADCAAELLVTRGSVLDPTLRDGLLDLLVTGEPGSYAAHVQAFEQDYTSFYPSRLQRAGDSPIQSYESAVVQHLQQRLAKLLQKNAALRERVEAQDARVQWLTARVEELKRKRRSVT